MQLHSVYQIYKYIFYKNIDYFFMIEIDNAGKFIVIYLQVPYFYYEYIYDEVTQ